LAEAADRRRLQAHGRGEDGHERELGATPGSRAGQFPGDAERAQDAQFDHERDGHAGRPGPAVVIGVHRDRGADGHPGHVAGQRHAAVHRQLGPRRTGRHAKQHQVARDHAGEHAAKGEEGSRVHRARGDGEQHHQQVAYGHVKAAHG
jgi:hypothetical protein